MDAFIGFSKSTKKFRPLGFLIEAFQEWKFSHSFISIFIQSQKDWYVVDATSHGVRVRTMAMFLKENRIVKKYALENCSQESASKLLFWGLEKSGLKYPKIEVFGNMIQLIWFKLSGKVIKNPFPRGNNPRCNELCAQVLIELYGHNIDADLDSIDLLWLDNYLIKIGLRVIK